MRSSKKVLLEHPRLTVIEDSVTLPSGFKTKYLRFENLPDSSMVIVKDNEGRILVQKEYSYPPDEILLQLPGGALEPHETPIDGARRELSEEAGLACQNFVPLGWFYIDNRRSPAKMHLFLADGPSSTVVDKDPEEEFEYIWMKENAIDQLIAHNEVRSLTLLCGWALYKTRGERDTTKA